MNYEFIAHFVTWGFLIAIILNLRGVGSSKLPKPPKPPKTYVCPHGRVAAQKPHIAPDGQKRVLCDYCYNKEGGVSYDLPRL